MKRPNRLDCRRLRWASFVAAVLAIAATLQGHYALQRSRIALRQATDSHARLLDRQSLMQAQSHLWRDASHALDERLERIELAVSERLHAPSPGIRVDSVSLVRSSAGQGLLRAPLRVTLQARAAHLPAFLDWIETALDDSASPWPWHAEDCTWQRMDDAFSIEARCSYRLLLPDWQAREGWT